MPPLLPDPVARLLSLLKTSGPRIIVGLAGLPGAGKSALTAQVALEVNARTGLNAMQTLGMDGFHLSCAQLQARPDAAQLLARRGAPWTFDVAGLAARLRLLRFPIGEDVQWPDFEHEVGDPVEGAHRVLASTRLILVEGLYLLCEEDGWKEIGEAFDERWFLDTPFDTAIERLVARHQKAWNIDQQSAIQRVESNDRFNAELVLASRPNAHWRIQPEPAET